MQTIINSEENKKTKMIFYGSAFMVGTCLAIIGCSECYRLGYSKGKIKGKNCVLNRIVDRSIKNGLTMVNSNNETYLFTAKLIEQK